MLSYFWAAVFLGVLTEALAYALALWLYHVAWMRLFNVLVIFGVLFGGLAWLLAGQPWWQQMAVGAVIGTLIEVANDRFLKIWYFPGDPWTFLKGRTAVIGIGLSWALVPPIIGWAAVYVLY
jgi:hypothetical protein